MDSTSPNEEMGTFADECADELFADDEDDAWDGCEWGVEGGNPESDHGRHPLPNADDEHLGGTSGDGSNPRRAAQGNRQIDRYHCLPVIVISYPDGTTRPAPFLMDRDEVAAFFRLHDSNTKFPDKTIQRYRRMGLRTVRIGRRVWFRLDDVLRFLAQQQDRCARG